MVSNIYLSLIYVFYCWTYLICRNKRPGCLISRNNKKFPKSIGFVYSPLWKITHQKPWVLCTSPLWKHHPSKPIGFVYSPLWKITHQSPSVLCSPPFEKSLFLVGAYFGKYGLCRSLDCFPTVYKVKNSFSLKNACTSWLMHLKDLPFSSWCWTPSTTITYEYSINIINTTRTSTVKKKKKKVCATNNNETMKLPEKET